MRDAADGADRPAVWDDAVAALLHGELGDVHILCRVVLAREARLFPASRAARSSAEAIT